MNNCLKISCNLRKQLLLFLLIQSNLLFYSCNEQQEKKRNSSDQGIADGASGSIESLASDISRGGRTKKVTATSLNSDEFTITRLTIGMKEYMSTEVPNLVFTLPANSDYAELYRCPADLVISSENVRTSIKDNSECITISSATKDQYFTDTWVPSGNYKYFAVPCVNPNRLVVSSIGSSDPCSRNVAASSIVKDYVNKKADSYVQSKRDSDSSSAKIDGITKKIVEHGDKWIQFEQACNLEDKIRRKKTAKRQAVAKIIGASLEFGLELKTVVRSATAKTRVGGKTVVKKKGLRKHFMTPGGAMDLLGIIAALGGYSFAVPFTHLASVPDDWPRGCPEARRVDQELKIQLESLLQEALLYKDLVQLSEDIKKGTQAISGDETVSFEKVEVPEDISGTSTSTSSSSTEGAW